MTARHRLAALLLSLCAAVFLPALVHSEGAPTNPVTAPAPIVGIAGAGPDNLVSVLAGEPFQAAVTVQATSEGDYRYEVLDGPAGLRLDGPRLHYRVPADATPGQVIPFRVRITHTATGVGRTLKGGIYPMARHVVASARVEPGSGVQEVSAGPGGAVVRVRRDALSAPLRVEIIQGRTADGEVETHYRFDSPAAASGAVEIVAPQGIREEDGSEAPPRMAKAPRTASLYPEETWAYGDANFIDLETCGVWKMGNRVGDTGKVFMSHCLLSKVSPTGFISPVSRRAWELNSECAEADTGCYTGQVAPILFVHGYNPGIFGLGGGSGTWDNFPAAIKQAIPSARVFEFRWRTSARFEEVAGDLAQAIALIQRKTGKRVHIIAHSFGGILTRTYLQRLAEGHSSYAGDVASVSTLGTPHSGIFHPGRFAHGVRFPNGQDGQGQALNFLTGVLQMKQCHQISCFQMGADTGFTQKALKVYGLDRPDTNSTLFDVPDNWDLDRKPGKFITVLQDVGRHPLAAALPFQVLIGLSTSRDEGVRLDRGDGLISFEGQRFLRQGGAYLDASTSGGGVVTERLLGMDGHVDPKDPTVYVVGFSGYRHTGLVVGPGDAIPEAQVSAACAAAATDCATAETHAGFLASRDWIKAVDTDQDGTPDVVDEDNDNDGMPDLWEIAYRFDPYSVVDAFEDADGDGATNRAEYQADTDPRDPNSRPAVALPGRLNDTGIDWGANYPSGNNTTCTGAMIAAQDCKQGRDATHNNDADGHAGFSFRKLDARGNELDPSAPGWNCVRDRVTGLTWEVKASPGNNIAGDEGLHDADDRFSWYNTNPATNGGAEGYVTPTYGSNWCYGYNPNLPNTACNTQAFVARVNAAGRCGYHDWRLPTRKELRSIVDYGRVYPAIDANYFPDSQSALFFWSSSALASYSGGAWLVDFPYGGDGSDDRGNGNAVRLVRGGQ